LLELLSLTYTRSGLVAKILKITFVQSNKIWAIQDSDPFIQVRFGGFKNEEVTSILYCIGSPCARTAPRWLRYAQRREYK
jgi:hypothetical protein